MVKSMGKVTYNIILSYLILYYLILYYLILYYLILSYLIYISLYIYIYMYKNGCFDGKIIYKWMFDGKIHGKSHL